MPPQGENKTFLSFLTDFEDALIIFHVHTEDSAAAHTSVKSANVLAAAQRKSSTVPVVLFQRNSSNSNIASFQRNGSRATGYLHNIRAEDQNVYVDDDFSDDELDVSRRDNNSSSLHMAASEDARPQVQFQKSSLSR